MSNAMGRTIETLDGQEVRVTTRLYDSGRARVTVAGHVVSRPGVWTFLRDGEGNSVRAAREVAGLDF